MMLIGCLEREFLKNGLNSDVNSKLKSDLIIDINFTTLTHPWDYVVFEWPLTESHKSKHYSYDQPTYGRGLTNDRYEVTIDKFLCNKQKSPPKITYENLKFLKFYCGTPKRGFPFRESG